MRTPGTLIGPYELLAVIGAGGMGEVWRAKDTRLSRTVAIKFSQPEFTQRFEREARAIAALNHPHIGQIYDVGDGYIVMEYVDGAPVRPPDSPRKLVDMAVQIADGLAAAHGAGFVHRDLKPGNVLMSKDGQIKILDFGLAKQASAPAQDATRTLELTQAGMALGTVPYMSPEQASGGSVDARSDQFSFGVLLYELATGKQPFRRASGPETMVAIIRDDAEPLPAYLPAPFRWIVERCLAKEPANRYDSTRDLYHDLCQIRDRFSEAVSAGGSVAAGARPRRRVLPLALGAAVAIMAGALVANALAPWNPDLSRYRLKPFANETYAEFTPAWAPNGRSIAYAARIGLQFKLLVKGLEGAPPVVLALIPNRPSSIGWSGDSTRVYYVVDARVYSVSVAGGDPAPVTDKAGVTSAAVSPDGQRLALSVIDRTAGVGVRRLFISSPPGAAPRMLDNFRPECCIGLDTIAWSGDSSHLLVTIPTDGGSQYWIVPLHGAPRQIFSTPQFLRWQVSAWAPDNRYAMVPWPGDSSEARGHGIYVLDTETGRLKAVLPTAEPVWAVAPSPDGKRIAVEKGGAHYSLVEIPLDGKAIRPLSTSSLDQSWGAWSPTGAEYAYVGGEDLHVRSRQGEADRLIVSHRDFPDARAILLSAPAFSPDGQRLAYWVLPGTRHTGVWISPAAGGPPVLLSDLNLNTPAWSPDGKWIAANLYENSGNSLVKLQPGSSAAPVTIRKDSCQGLAWSPDGRWISCPTPKGLLIVAADGSETRELGKVYGQPNAWAANSAGLYVIRTEGNERRFGLLDIQSSSFRRILDIPPDLILANPTWGPRFSPSPDGKSVMAPIETGTSDIWILEGYEPPPSLWRRMFRW